MSRRRHLNAAVDNAFILFMALALAQVRPAWMWWPVSEGYFWRVVAVVGGMGLLCNLILAALPKERTAE